MDLMLVNLSKNFRLEKEKLMRIYSGAETWESVRKKVWQWIPGYLSLLGLHNNKADPLIPLHECFSTQATGIVFSFSYLVKDENGEFSLIYLELLDSTPGIVIVRENKRGCIGEARKYPLIDLTCFTHLKEAQEWVEWNPNFYKWKSLMGKI